MYVVCSVHVAQASGRLCQKLHFVPQCHTTAKAFSHIITYGWYLKFRCFPCAMIENLLLVVGHTNAAAKLAHLDDVNSHTIQSKLLLNYFATRSVSHNTTVVLITPWPSQPSAAEPGCTTRTCGHTAYQQTCHKS